MILRSSTGPRAWTWNYMPLEVRLMILEAIAYQKNPGWASLASVCREWQAVLEKANFHKLKLRVPCLDDFESMVPPHKRGLVSHLWLDIELPRYTSACCSKKVSPPVKNSSFVSDAIWELFSILSTWKPANNLTLELNVLSPSDSEHWFKNSYFSSDHVEDDEDTINSARETGIPLHDPQHGWVHGQQVTAPPRSAMQRLSRPIHLTFREMLPQVDAVTCLLIRRQLRRCISPFGFGLLLSKFDRLEHISYEPWAPYEKIDTEFHQGGLAFTIRNNLPQTLNRLVVFEDAHEFYHALPQRATPVPSSNLIDHGLGIGAAFASKSRGLQHLAVSFIITAEEFFRRCRSTWSWPHLQSLAFTSQLLQDDWGKRDDIETLLCRAGVFVQQMPKLHTFVIWNGGKANACAFIYRVDGDGASITWRGTWRLEMSPDIVNSWRQANSTRSSFELQIKQERIQAVIASHGDAIYHLELPCEVIHPASLWQIRREVGS
ncbi:hypothetical protein PT974_01145 [Cladobotryum mycophilum]|uniref:DUF6546 domain-containing protein n=1 Tax=Cladobotryum mycophilum TaxID=491253 RepID=A0ABR0T2W0_9HYPO